MSDYPKTSEELCQWLRDNSSGVYRPAQDAADLIKRLERQLAEAREDFAAARKQVALDTEILQRASAKVTKITEQCDTLSTALMESTNQLYKLARTNETYWRGERYKKLVASMCPEGAGGVGDPISTSWEGARGPTQEPLTVADYEEVLADHRRLVRELDILLNGEEGAAKQASLSDIVAQVRHEKANGVKWTSDGSMHGLDSCHALPEDLARLEAAQQKRDRKATRNNKLK